MSYPHHQMSDNTDPSHFSSIDSTTNSVVGASPFESVASTSDDGSSNTTPVNVPNNQTTPTNNDPSVLATFRAMNALDRNTSELPPTVSKFIIHR